MASIVFWTLLSPLALVWLTLWLIGRVIDRHRAVEKSPTAKRDRRVARLLHWYPADWRARYGEEMVALLHDTIAEGRGSPLLSLNIAKEGVAAWLAPPERRQALAWLCLGLCAIPLIPQGLVPAIMILTETPARSWFLALYLPEAYRWPTLAAMLILGLAMLRTGLTLAGVRLNPSRA